METWGNWTFNKENEHLLAEVLNKFETEQCSNISRKVVLSSLAASSKTRFEVSCSSSDGSDSDIDSDFAAVETCFQKFIIVNDETMESTIVDKNPNISTNAYGSESFFQSQTLPSPIISVDCESTVKLIIELLNVGNCNVKELYSLLKNEQKNRNNISKIIGEIWPEMITDKARHGLCEALVTTSVQPQIICEQTYMRWFKMCESNMTGFIDSLTKLIVHFSEYACKYFLIELLKDKESILVKHMDWLAEIMKSLDQQHWCTLLSEYMKCCNSVHQYQIPVLLFLVKNCHKSLNYNEAEQLVILCRNAALEHSANRDFALFLVSVIGAIDLNKFRPEMITICGRLKGASKFLLMKALKDAK